MSDVKQKEAKENISKICSNPSSSGGSFPENNNLILIKLGENIFCFTPPEIRSILFSYEIPTDIVDIGIPPLEFLDTEQKKSLEDMKKVPLNLPAIIQPPNIPEIDPNIKKAVSKENLKKLQNILARQKNIPASQYLDFDKILEDQNDQKKWLYKIPYAQVWVDSSLTELYREKINTMELVKQDSKIKIFKSIGVGSIYDYPADIYRAEKRHRFYFLPGQIGDFFSEEQGKLILVEEFKQEHPINSIVVSPDGKYLYSSSSKGDIYKWDIRSVTVVEKFENSNATQLVLSEDGKYIFSSLFSKDTGMLDTIIKWDTVTGKQIKTIKVPDTLIGGFVISPDEKYIYSKFISSIAKLEIDSGKVEKMAVSQPIGMGFAISLDGKYIFSGRQNKGILQIDTQTGNVVKIIKSPSVLKILISPNPSDEKYIYTISVPSGAQQLKAISVINIVTGKVVTEIIIEKNIKNIAVSPNGRFIYYNIHKKGEIVEWDTYDNKISFLVNMPDTIFTGLSISPEGRFLYTGVSNTILQWVFTD